MTSARALAERWTTTDGRQLAFDAAARLVTGRPLDNLPLARHEGRLDLRGLVLPSPVELGRHEVAGGTLRRLAGAFTVERAEWRGLDLSGARLQSLRFDKARIIDCVLDGADCRDWRLWDTTVERSSFRRADLRDSGLGGWSNRRGCRWIGVTFDRARMRENTTTGTTFTGCSFGSTDLTGMHFEGCEFTDVVFDGELREVIFDFRPVRGRPRGGMSRVDFSGAVFREVEINGAHLAEVTLPPGVTLVPRVHEVARRQLGLLKGDDSDAAETLRGALEYELEGPQDKKADGIFVKDDYEAYGPGVADLAERTLRAALA